MLFQMVRQGTVVIKALVHPVEEEPEATVGGCERKVSQTVKVRSRCTFDPNREEYITKIRVTIKIEHKIRKCLSLENTDILPSFPRLLQSFNQMSNDAPECCLHLYQLVIVSRVEFILKPHPNFIRKGSLESIREMVRKFFQIMEAIEGEGDEG